MAQIKFTKIKGLRYTASYNPLTPDSQSIVYDTSIYKSYAKIELANLETISGNVDNIEIYGKQDTDISEYSLLAKKQIIGNNLFVTESNLTLVPYGLFNYVNKYGDVIYVNNDFAVYWSSSHSVPNSNIPPYSIHNFLYCTSSFCGVTYGVGQTASPDGEYVYDINEYGLLTPNSMSLNLYKGIDYQMSFNISGKTVHGNYGTDTNYFDSMGDVFTEVYCKDAVIQFILSGSAFTGSINNEKVISQLQISASLYDGTYRFQDMVTFGFPIFENRIKIWYERNFENIKCTFTPDQDGTVYLKIKVLNGKWAISELIINCDTELGYTPAQTYTYVEVPTDFPNNLYDFKIMYYTYDGIRSNNISYATNKIFNGKSYGLPNTLIGNNDYIPVFRTGSLYLANSYISQSAYGTSPEVHFNSTIYAKHTITSETVLSAPMIQGTDIQLDNSVSINGGFIYLSGSGDISGSGTLSIDGVSTFRNNINIYTENSLGTGINIYASSSLGIGANTQTWIVPDSAQSSYVHFGVNGDWYIRPYDSAGNVIISDSGNQVLIGSATPVAGSKLRVVGSMYVQGPLSASSAITTTAPTATGTPAALNNSYGTNVRMVLTEPNVWIEININGVKYKIPAYQ